MKWDHMYHFGMYFEKLNRHTFLREWWSCKQTLPSPPGNRPRAAGSQPSQSFSHCHSSHRRGLSIGGNPAKRALGVTSDSQVPRTFTTPLETKVWPSLNLTPRDQTVSRSWADAVCSLGMVLLAVLPKGWPAMSWWERKGCHTVLGVGRDQKKRGHWSPCTSENAARMRSLGGGFCLILMDETLIVSGQTFFLPDRGLSGCTPSRLDMASMGGWLKPLGFYNGMGHGPIYFTRINFSWEVVFILTQRPQTVP